MITQRLRQLQLAQPIAIIGMGVTGKSCFDLLRAAEIDCCVFDERDSVSHTFKDHAEHVCLGAFGDQHFVQYGTVLVSPGVDIRRTCFAHCQEQLLTDIELFAQLTDKPLIGVTGSNGKSTVVTLVHAVTQAAHKKFALCGNIGTPVLQALREFETSADGYIIELSSYQLERAPSLQLTVGAWLNVSPDHLDRYNSYEHYAATKAKILQQSAYSVVNADDALVMQCVHQYCQPESTLTFSRQNNHGNYSLDGEMIMRDGTALFALSNYPQIGSHHAENLMAVFAIAERLQIAPEIVAATCSTYTPLPCRSVVVGTKNNISFINDSKGTNIGATAAALSGINQPIILLAGGQGKNQDFNELARAATNKVKQAILFGEDADVIATALTAKINCCQVNDLTQAFETALATAAPGDVVMLSPACASFDMYPSYLKRGEHFEALVNHWIHGDEHE